MLQDYTKKLSCLSESIRRSILEMLRLIKKSHYKMAYNVSQKTCRSIFDYNF